MFRTLLIKNLFIFDAIIAAFEIRVPLTISLFGSPEEELQFIKFLAIFQQSDDEVRFSVNCCILYTFSSCLIAKLSPSQSFS